MYILAPDLLKKNTINTHLKLEICVVCMDLAFKYIFMIF